RGLPPKSAHRSSRVPTCEKRGRPWQSNRNTMSGTARKIRGQLCLEVRRRREQNHGAFGPHQSSRYSGNSVACPRSAPATKRLIDLPQIHEEAKSATGRGKEVNDVIEISKKICS